MTYGEFVDSTMIEVKFDPRVDITMATLQAKYSYGKRLEKNQQIAADALKRLRESSEIAEDYAKRLAELDKEAYKEQIDASKAIQDSIKLLMEPIVGKESDLQGIVSFLEVPVSSRLRSASGYMQSSLQAPGPTEERLMQQAEDQLRSIVNEVNSFYQSEWPAYRRAMESLEVTPFKDYDPIKW
jgi:hypothetical protein